MTTCESRVTKTIKSKANADSKMLELVSQFCLPKKCYRVKFTPSIAVNYVRIVINLHKDLCLFND